MALTKITKSGITDSAVDNNKIEADAVDATKIADNAISEEHLDETVITGNTELSANAASDDILLIYDASNGTLKKINAGNVGLQAPTISSVSPTNVLSGDGTGNYTFTITGTGFIADATAKITTDGGTDIAFDSVTRNSSTQLTCVVAKNTANLTNANEPFDITVTTAGALSTTSADAFTIDASPVFVTASGSLGTGTGNTAESFSVNATDPESAAAVTFELQSGTIPPGLSLSNSTVDGGTAIISGTATDPVANTTYNFTLRAVDAASNTTSRAFSITINKQIQYQTFTTSGTFSVPSGMTTLTEVLVVGGGGGGGDQHGGGGGAGGLIFFPCYPVSPGGTVTVTVGCGGAGGTGNADNPACKGSPGQDSSFGSPSDPGFSPTSTVLTAKGGGGGGTYNALGGREGGSGGGGGNQSSGATGTQPTQPGNSGAYGFGNPGGSQGSPAGGGGGGAGSAGGSGMSGPGGQGGTGKAYTIADGTTPVYYAGGGGGGGHVNPTPPGVGGQGGQGGGGDGGKTPCGTSSGIPGQANKGGGGGGSCNGGAPTGNGGKGVVIVKY